MCPTTRFRRLRPRRCASRHRTHRSRNSRRRNAARAKNSRRGFFVPHSQLAPGRAARKSLTRAGKKSLHRYENCVVVRVAANWGGGYGIDSFDIFGSERSFGIVWQTTPRGRPGTSRSRYPAPRTPNSPGRGIDDFFGPRTGGGERGFSDGPRYGNWGGKNWSGGPSGNGQPIDSSDEAYERHDRCYASCAGKSTTRSGRYPKPSEFQKCIRSCDNQLVTEIKNLPRDPRSWPRPPPDRGMDARAREFADAAIFFFE